MEALQVQPEVLDEKYWKQNGYQKQTIARKLSADERKELRIIRDHRQDEIAEVEEEKKNEMMNFNETIKLKKKQLEPISKQIKTGYIEEEMMVRMSPNYIDNEMEYFDTTGELVHRRELKPIERQMTLLTPYKD